MAENKVLGIDTGKYAYICYILILLASGFGLLGNLLGLMNMHIFGGSITSILGLIGIGLTVTALIGFKDRFSSLDVSHFIFLIIVFVASLILAFALGGALINMSVFGSILLFLLSALQFALLFSGFKAWKQGQEATKDNIIISLKNLTSQFKS